MNESTQVVKKVSGAVTMWGVLTILLGFFAMGSPLITGLALAMMIGVAMIVAGVAQTFYAFQAGSVGRGILRLLFGGVTVLAGIAIMAQPGMALATLTLFLAIYFVVDGLTTIFASAAVEKGKGMVIFNGVITLILGLMIWSEWPVSGVWAIGILLGIRLIFSGMTMLMLGSVGRGVADGLK